MQELSLAHGLDRGRAGGHCFVLCPSRLEKNGGSPGDPGTEPAGPERPGPVHGRRPQPGRGAVPPPADARRHGLGEFFRPAQASPLRTAMRAKQGPAEARDARQTAALCRPLVMPLVKIAAPAAPSIASPCMAGEGVGGHGNDGNGLGIRMDHGADGVGGLVARHHRHPQVHQDGIHIQAPVQIHPVLRAEALHHARGRGGGRGAGPGDPAAEKPPDLPGGGNAVHPR